MEIALIVIGWLLGLVTSVVVFVAERWWQGRQDEQYTREVLRSLALEVHEGIGRAREMVRQLDEGKVSLGRIYVGLWDATAERLAATLNDAPTLALLHRSYYRFDLVNFNCDRNLPDAGAAFAKEYLIELETNYCRLLALVQALAE